MRHQRLRGKLGVKSKHRKALLRNLVRNLVIRKRIRTTFRKAKVASAFADSMVELAKRGDLHARRVLISRLACPDTANALITQIAPRFKDRRGGYTRVLRLGNRPGDGGMMALLEFTETFALPEKEKKPKKEKKPTKLSKAEPLEKTKKEKAKVKEKAKEKAESKLEEPKTAESQQDKDKKESEKKGGFLSALRRFLKGDEESNG